MLKRHWILFIWVTFLGNPGAYASHPYQARHEQTFTTLSKNIQRLIDKGSLDGVAIAVVNEAGMLWSANFGYANRAAKIKISDNTVFRVGSLTKLFTATAILQLEELGIIDIDQAVSAYLPRFYYKTRFSETGVITSRQLLTHLSGLPSNINKGLWSEERFTELVERLRTEYTSYPTDFILNYSNVGYSLLGTIIEETTGYLFEDYMQKHLFNPLQMSQSNFQPYGSTGKQAAIGYRDHKAQHNLPIRDIPALGLNTSLNDLTHFVAALLNHGHFKQHTILDPDSVESMYEIQNADVALDLDKAIGIPWFIRQQGDDTTPLIVEHKGTTLNFSSQIMLAPHQKIGIIMLTNSSRENSVINKISQHLLNDLINNQDLHPHILQSSNRHPVITDENKHRYIAQSGMVEIDPQSKSLCDCQTNRIINLVPLPEGWFGISPDNKNFSSKISEQLIDGNEVMVVQKNGKLHRLGSRYVENDNHFNWEQYFGDYTIVNPDENFPVTDVRIFDEKNMIYMCYRMPKLSDKLIVLPITPVSTKEAITEGLGDSKGETVYSLNIDGKTHLVYSGYIARKIE